MIQLYDLVLRYGEAPIFDHISIVLPEQRIGVVGRNGAGKSTLLKMIDHRGAGLDDGAITVAGNRSIAYMPQEIVLTSDKTIFDETFSAFDQLAALQKEQELFEQLPDKEITVDMLERYAQAQEQIKELNPADSAARTEKMLQGLGFARDTFNKPVAQLSVGWKMRIVLAKLLLKRADFYLFDEPTNHLDMVSKEWFSSFLKSADFSFLLVTHDRYFLEHTCNHIFELERGKGTLYNGNFSSYLAQKEHAAAIKQAAFDRQQKEIGRKQAVIDKFRSGTRAKMAQSMLKQLDKIERIEPDPVMPTVKFNFTSPARAGHQVLSFDNLEQSFNGVSIFKNISGSIIRGEKVAVVGANGSGKTTLFNIINGSYPRQMGFVEFGHNVTFAVFEQDQLKALSLTNTVYQEVLDACPGVPEVTVRKFLGAFLFTGDDVYKKINVLSGGERGRVALVKVLLQNANFLLLDEPTNHLDLYAKEVLLQALQQYEGTILLVCHDHDFLERLATRVLELTPTALHSYPGTYESYLAQARQKEVSTIAQRNAKQAPARPQHEKKHDGLDTLEAKIARLEKQLKDIDGLFAQCPYDSPAYKNAVAERERAVKALEEAMQLWQKRV